MMRLTPMSLIAVNRISSISGFHPHGQHRSGPAIRSKPWILLTVRSSSDNSDFEKNFRFGLSIEIQSALDQHACSFYDHVENAAAAMEKVLEIPRSAVYKSVLDNQKHWDRKGFDRWAKINRGSDLFLKGLGSFDITEIYESWKDKEGRLKSGERLLRYFKREGLVKMLVENVYKGPKSAVSRMDRNEVERLLMASPTFNPVPALLEEIRAGNLKSVKSGHDVYLKQMADDIFFPSRWYADVTALQIHAYFPDSWNASHREDLEEVLNAPSDCPARVHLLKYHRGWCQPQNAASLDEISGAAVARRNNVECCWPDNWERMKPETLLNALREMTRLNLGAPKTGNYVYLNALPNHGRLRVLRSADAIRQAGAQLKNCAFSYAGRVESERCVLVALDRTPGKPDALGMIELHASDADISKTWSQIYLSCNKAAPDDVKQEFYDYETILRPWFRELCRQRVEDAKKVGHVE